MTSYSAVSGGTQLGRLSSYFGERGCLVELEPTDGISTFFSDSCFFENARLGLVRSVVSEPSLESDGRV